MTFLSNQSVCKVTQCASLIVSFCENRCSALFAFLNIYSILSDRTISQTTIYRWFKKLDDRASDTPSKSLQTLMRLEVVDEMVETVDQNPYYT